MPEILFRHLFLQLTVLRKYRPSTTGWQMESREPAMVIIQKKSYEANGLRKRVQGLRYKTSRY